MRRMEMRVTHDPDVDMGYIYLVPIAPGEAVRSEALAFEHGPGEVVVDFDCDGHIIGIEIFDASRLLPPAVIAEAIRPGS